MTLFAVASLVVLFASAAPAGAAVTAFTNATGIAIPDSGAANPYPSEIAVSGLCGVVSKATVSLSGLSHPYAMDVDVLLVAPDGEKTLLMSDAGASSDFLDVDLLFDDAAPSSVPRGSLIGSGTYKPTNYEDSNYEFPDGPGGEIIEVPVPDVFPAPAPPGPYVASLAEVNGAAANGTWQLFVFDDSGRDEGVISGGWTLNLSTPDCPTPAPTPTAQPASTPSQPAPEPAAAPAARDATAPIATMAGVRRGCASRTFSIRVTARDQVGTVARVSVSLDRRRVASTSKTDFRLKVLAGRLRPGTHTLRVTATDAAGNRKTTARRFTRCQARQQLPRFTG